MKQKYTASLLLSSTLIALTVLLPQAAFAEGTDLPNLRATIASRSGTLRNEITQKVASKSAAVLSARETSLKNRADTEIGRRIAAMNELITKLNGLNRIPASDKTQLTSEIQSEITDLTNLKSKIDSDTDLSTLRTDVQSIVASYRIFALYMPKIEILGAVDAMMTANTNLTTLAGKLQTRITDAQNAGQTVTSLQQQLADMNAKIADAKTHYTTAENTVLPLSPDGYPGNVTQLKAARTDLQTARQDMKAALADAKTMTIELRTLEHSTKEASGSASASAIIQR